VSLRILHQATTTSLHQHNLDAHSKPLVAIRKQCRAEKICDGCARQAALIVAIKLSISLTLRSTIWFFCDACHKLEVDIYFLARSGVDIIETGWNLS
jgi:hypothetical protein